MAKKQDDEQDTQQPVAGGKTFPPTPYQPGDLEVRWARATSGNSREFPTQE